MTVRKRDHFSDAWRIYLGFIEENFGAELQAHRDRVQGSYARIDDLHVAPENLKEQQPGHFVLYTDVLGFSEGVSQGYDSLPDFYGGALVGAHRHREINVYVLSDTCLAVCTREHGTSLFEFITEYVSSLQQDGILHQSYVGFGTFVERRPQFSIAPNNFLGTQIVGTAVVDAVEQSKTRPLGSRVLVSDAALAETSATVQESVRHLTNGEHDYLPERAPQFDIFDCIYYFLCLRDHAQGSRAYDHYVWSIASRTARLGSEPARIAMGLVAQSDPAFRSEEMLSAVNEVLCKYQNSGAAEAGC
jgi:hypothetical protein